MLPDGSFKEFGSIEYPNTSDETHIANTNIPPRAEVGNTGNTSDLSIKIGSVTAGVVDGGGADPSSRTFTFEIPSTTLIAGATTQLVTFRNKTTYKGLTNKVTSQLLLISSATDGNKPVKWGIQKNAVEVTPGTATWNDVGPDSVMEYSSDYVANLATGSLLIPWNMSRVDSFFEDVEKFLLQLRPNQTATIYALCPTASDIELGIRWKELF
jgi:urocanate hydratase